jgi:hypothetical protein
VRGANLISTEEYMNLTAYDFGSMVDWMKNPLLFRDHTVSFGLTRTLVSNPNFAAATYAGNLTYTEGTVAGDLGNAHFPKSNSHDTHSKLSGKGTAIDGDSVELTITFLPLHVSMTFIGNLFKKASSSGPFEKSDEGPGLLEFKVQDGGDIYKVHLQQHGTDGVLVKKHLA